MTERMQAALRITRILGMVPTFPNLRVIEAAVECEAGYLAISLGEAEDLILRAALASPPITITRFFFEDGRWRDTVEYAEFLARRGTSEHKVRQELLSEGAA
jgi:hypothetical protein